MHRDVVISASYWVRTANLCDRLKCLPWQGTVYDSDPRDLDRFEQALRAIDDVIQKKTDEEAKKK